MRTMTVAKTGARQTDWNRGSTSMAGLALGRSAPCACAASPPLWRRCRPEPPEEVEAAAFTNRATADKRTC